MTTNTEQPRGGATLAQQQVSWERFMSVEKELQDMTAEFMRVAHELAAIKAHQQEPVAKVCHDLDGHIGWNPKLTELPDEGTLLYTSPPNVPTARASKPWVGLTNNELQPICDEYRILFGSWVEDFASAIEAKLREKNEHREKNA